MTAHRIKPNRVRSRWKKQGVGPSSERTYNGTKYRTQASMDRAVQLDLLTKSGDIAGWIQNVRFRLGGEFNHTADFLVWEAGGLCHVEELTGHSRILFKIAIKLWPQHGPVEMILLGPKGHDKCGDRQWTIERVPGNTQLETYGRCNFDPPPRYAPVTPARGGTDATATHQPPPCSGRSDTPGS